MNTLQKEGWQSFRQTREGSGSKDLRGAWLGTVACFVLGLGILDKDPREALAKTWDFKMLLPEGLIFLLKV